MEADISANRYNFFNAYIRENKSYNAFRLTVYERPFLQKAGYRNDELLKNVLMKGLILFAAIYQMHAVLNLLIIDEKKN